MEKQVENILSLKEGYEAMILMLHEYYTKSGSSDLTDILSGGEYIDGEPADIGIWYMWVEAVLQIQNGAQPKEKKWISD